LFARRLLFRSQDAALLAVDTLQELGESGVVRQTFHCGAPL
jgi:hypothetical protein